MRTPTTLDIGRIRAAYPSLAVADEGRPRVYFDNPGGTQVPQRVIDRTVDCLLRTNANLGGPFASSVAAGAMVDERSEEHTSELQSLMRISYAVFCLKKKNKT